jgi:hypothetical protein
MGYAAAAAVHGSFYSWHDNPRAVIFRRDQHTVQDLPSFQALLSYNDWQHDPAALNNSYNAIAARGDLVTPGQVTPLALMLGSALFGWVLTAAGGREQVWPSPWMDVSAHGAIDVKLTNIEGLRSGTSYVRHS